MVPGISANQVINGLSDDCAQPQLIQLIRHQNDNSVAKKT